MGTSARLSRLLRLDLGIIARDPLLALFPFVPLLVLGLARLGLPLLRAPLLAATGIDLAAHGPLLVAILLLFPASFAGLSAGFIMLEERDGGLVAYAAVLPGGRPAYLALRLGPPALLAFAYAAATPFVLAPATGGALAEPGLALPAALVAALEAPMFALALGALANDRMAGLATAKALGILDLAPLAVLAPPWLRTLALLLPPTWIAEAALASGGEAPVPVRAAWLAGGALAHVAACLVLWRRLRSRAD